LSLDRGRGLPLPAQWQTGPMPARPGRSMRTSSLGRSTGSTPPRHARSSLPRVGHRVGGRWRDRDDEGPAPRRRAIRMVDQLRFRSGRPNAPRHGSAGARSRRATDGVRGIASIGPTIPGPPALRKVAGKEQPARLARRPRHPPGRGRRASRPGREAPGAGAQDQCRVLRRSRADGGRSSNPTLFPATFSLARHAAGRPTRSSRRRRQPPHPPGRQLRRPRGARSTELRARDGIALGFCRGELVGCWGQPGPPGSCRGLPDLPGPPGSDALISAGPEELGLP